MFMSSLPRGIRNLVLINSLLMLWTGWNAFFWLQHKSDFAFWFYAVETVLFLVIGPLLIIRNRLIYRVSRPLIYLLLLAISLLLMMMIPKGALADHTLATVFNIVLIIYLIGARGYLNEGHVREYYGVPEHAGK